MPGILIADRRSITRTGLRRILEQAYPCGIVQEAMDEMMMFRMIRQSRWDLVIADIAVSAMNGLGMLKMIKTGFPKLPVLVFSSYPVSQYALRVLRAGGSGYLDDSTSPEELLMAVERILEGKKYITHTVAERLADELCTGKISASHQQLSDRELEVLKMIARGTSIRCIASNIFVSSSTVSTYRARIMQKLCVKTNAALTMYALSHRLI
jgi:two-component system invasion response regulator UvrY